MNGCLFRFNRSHEEAFLWTLIKKMTWPGISSILEAKTTWPAATETLLRAQRENSGVFCAIVILSRTISLSICPSFVFRKNKSEIFLKYNCKLQVFPSGVKQHNSPQISNEVCFRFWVRNILCPSPSTQNTAFSMVSEGVTWKSVSLTHQHYTSTMTRVKKPSYENIETLWAPLRVFQSFKVFLLLVLFLLLLLPYLYSCCLCDSLFVLLSSPPKHLGFKSRRLINAERLKT